MVLLAAGLLAGCVGELSLDGDDDGQSVEDGTDDEPDDGYEDGPAPSGVGSGWDGKALRVDEVTREGEVLRLQMVVANVGEDTFRDEDVRLLTDGGIELPRAAEQERTLPARSRTEVELEVSGLTEDVGRLQLDAVDVSIEVPMPEDGQTLRWRPAPLRQTGFVDGVVRDASFLETNVYTFRTEGMISEVTYLVTNASNVNPALCTYRNINACYLQDRSGQTYPLLGPTHDFAEWGQVRGTWRFLGEIPPEVDELTLVMQGASGFMTAAEPAIEYTFAVPSAEDSPARAVATDTMPEPFVVGETISEGVVDVELGEISFYDDRIQLDVVAEVGDGNAYLNWSGEAVLRDPAGFDHVLRGPPENRDLEFEADRSVEVTLVFLTRVSPEADQLELILINGRDRGYGTVIELPTNGVASDDDAATGDADPEDDR